MLRYSTFFSLLPHLPRVYCIFSTPFEVFIECTVKTLRCLSIASYHNFAPRQACIFSRVATKKLVSQVFGGCPKISFSCQSNAQTSVMIPKEQKKVSPELKNDIEKEDFFSKQALDSESVAMIFCVAYAHL